MQKQQHRETSEHLQWLSDNVGAGFISNHSAQSVAGCGMNLDRLVELPLQGEIGSLGLSKVAGADRSSIILLLSGLKRFYETISHLVETTRDRLEGITGPKIRTVEPA